MAIEGAIVTAELRELCPDVAAKIEAILSMVDIIAPAMAAEQSEEMGRNRALAFETLRSMARVAIAEAKGMARRPMKLERPN